MTGKNNRAAKMLFAWTLFAILCLACVPTRAAHTNIKVAVECNLAPFQFVDENGKIAGMHVDIMNAIAETSDLTIEYIAYDKTSDAVAALKEGVVDVILGALPKDCPDNTVRLTENISSASLSLIVDNRYIDRVSGTHEPGSPLYTAAFEFGAMTLSQLSELNTMCIFIVGNQRQLFTSLTEGKVDAIVAVKDSILYQFDQAGGGLSEAYTVVNNYMGSVDYAIMTRTNDRVLRVSLNRSIATLRTTGDYEQILDSRITNSDLQAAEARIAKLMLYILLIVGFAVIALISIYYWNTRLKKLVDEKTSEIKHQMQQLREESALRNMLIEHSPNSIVLINRDGTLLGMNPRARAVSETKFGGERAMEMDELPVLGELWRQTRSHFEQDTMQSSAVVALNRANDEKKLYRYQYYSLNANGDKVLLLEDVTREERERNEIFEATKSQTLNRVIAGIAHEIKNPLMSIRAFASLISEQGGDADFQASFAQHVPSEVDRINRLVESLINYARPVSGLKEHVRLSQLVEECTCLTYAYAKNKMIRLVAKGDADAYILVNRDQIKQALINLILNGIESVQEKLAGVEREPEHGLEIRARIYRREKELICLEIYDEGLGMSEDEIRNCVEPFYTTKNAGTGMGLSLAKQFVHENGGEFEIESSQGAYTLMRMVFKEDFES